MRPELTAVLVVLLVAGCGGAQRTTTDAPATQSPTDRLVLTQTGEETRLVLYALRTEDVPDGAPVIPLSNESLDGDRVLKRVVRDVVRNGSEVRTLHERIHQRLEPQLEDLPRHDGQDAGYYFRYDDRIVHVYVVVRD
jgi:hypothetical protein